MAGSDHYFRTSVRMSVRPFVRPHFSNLVQVRIAIATVGLAEWIIDGTHVLC